MKLQFESSSDKQKEAAAAWIDDSVTDIVYGGAKGGGKSYLGAALIFHDALAYPSTRYFIARKKLIDLRQHTIPTIEKVFRDWGIDIKKYTSFNGVDHTYTCYNGSVVMLKEAKLLPQDPLYERFGSMEVTRGWIEEAGEFEASAKTNLAISIGRCNNEKHGLMRKLLQTCNPKKNYLYTDYYIPWRNGTLDPSKRFIQAFAHENRKLDAGYVEQLQANLIERDRERLLEGSWEYSDDAASLIQYQKILDVFDKNKDLVPGGRKRITADIARLGGDRIVIIEWDGWRGRVKWYKKILLTETATYLEAARTRQGCEKVDVLIDSDGMGVGIKDFVGYQSFVNNARPLPDPDKPYDRDGKEVKENFDMLKSQCFFRLADRINKNGVYLECEDELTRKLIIQELEQVKQKELDSDMKKGVMKKELVKEAIGRSPDFADTIMMREYFELKPVVGFRAAQY